MFHREQPDTRCEIERPTKRPTTSTARLHHRRRSCLWIVEKAGLCHSKLHSVHMGVPSALTELIDCRIYRHRKLVGEFNGGRRPAFDSNWPEDKKSKRWGGKEVKEGGWSLLNKCHTMGLPTPNTHIAPIKYPFLGRSINNSSTDIVVLSSTIVYNSTAEEI